MLHVDAIFHGNAPRNRATRLNERTWELGDVFEFFLLSEDGDAYLEIHVTPENQRLQLRWPSNGLTRVHAKKQKLEEFLVPDPHWVVSRTKIEDEKWSTHLSVPAHHCPVSRLRAGQRFRAAVCRYHYPAGSSEPVLSTTALLPQPGFHQPQHWHELVLADEDGAGEGVTVSP